MARNEIKVIGMLINEDGSIVPMDEATPEQLARFRENAARRLSERMSEYYGQHPEEFARLPG